MKNELLHLGPFTVYGYGTMIALGILCGWVVITRRAKKRGMDLDFLLSFILVAAGFGFLGAKLLFWIVNLRIILEDFSFFTASLLDGFVVIGGLLLGIPMAYAFCRKRGEDFFLWLDLLLPEVAVAQGFGRLGCFLAGCCYGKETAGRFAITFHESAFAPNGVPLYPTQLISSTLDFLNAVICILFSTRLKKGQVSALYLLNYSVGRFFLEFLRGDTERGHVGIFSTSQFICLGLFAAGLFFWMYAREKERTKGNGHGLEKDGQE